MLDQSASNMGTNSAVTGGFDNPVHDAQSTFKAVMDAMARPGTHQKLPRQAKPDLKMGRTIASLILTLCDADTPIWLDDTLRDDALQSWISFHTGAPIIERASEAQFAFCGSCDKLPPLQSFMLGTQDYPDRSTTLIVQCDQLEAGADVILSGPGIKETKTISLPISSAGFVETWKANRNLFPRGIDIVFAGPDAVMCLPRSIHMQLSTPVDD